MMEGKQGEETASFSLLRVGAYVIGGLTVAAFIWNSLHASSRVKSLRADFLKAKAQRRKERGNESFIRCEFSDAIQHYSKALEFDATNNGVLLDRAIAYLRSENLEQCAQDCVQILLMLEGREGRDSTLHRCYLVLGRSFLQLGVVNAGEEFLRCSLHYRETKQVLKALEKCSDVCVESPGAVVREEYSSQDESLGIADKHKRERLVAARDLQPGEVLFSEPPFASVRSFAQEASSLCHFCMKSLTSCESSADATLSSACQNCQKEFYCSVLCQARAWVQYHRVLCTRNIKISEERLEELEREEEALAFLKKHREKKLREKVKEQMEPEKGKDDDHPGEKEEIKKKKKKKAKKEKRKKQEEKQQKKMHQSPDEHPIAQLEGKCRDNQNELPLLLARMGARFVQLGCVELRKQWLEILQVPENHALSFEPELQLIEKALAPYTKDLSPPFGQLTASIQATVIDVVAEASNQAELPKGQGVYLLASLLSRAEEPNARWRFLDDTNRLCCVASRQIRKGEEITRSYESEAGVKM